MIREAIQLMPRSDNSLLCLTNAYVACSARIFSRALPVYVGGSTAEPPTSSNVIRHEIPQNDFILFFTADIDSEHCCAFLGHSSHLSSAMKRRGGRKTGRSEEGGGSGSNKRSLPASGAAAAPALEREDDLVFEDDFGDELQGDEAEGEVAEAQRVVAEHPSQLPKDEEETNAPVKVRIVAWLRLGHRKQRCGVRRCSARALILSLKAKHWSIQQTHTSCITQCLPSGRASVSMWSLTCLALDDQR